MARLIALVGLPGAGKSTATAVFLKHGYSQVYFGGITFEKLKESGQDVNEKNERAIREKLRADHGMAAYAILSLPKIEASLKKGDTVIDDMYSWEEYVYLKEKFPFLETVAVFAPPRLRYQRLEIRPGRPQTQEHSKSRETAQIENLNQGGPIARADWTLLNTGTEKYLVKQVEDYINGKS